MTEETKYTPAEHPMPTEVYSRCVGYLRPIDSWNKGKQQEYADRVNYAMGGGPVRFPEKVTDEAPVAERTTEQHS